jgi:hypothetical protein
MGEPVKTISLDDLGDLDGDQTQPFPSDLSNAFGSDFGRTGVSETSSSATNASSPFPSDFQTAPESVSLGTGTNAGTGVTRMTELFGSLSSSESRGKRIALVLVLLVLVGGSVLMLLGDVTTELVEHMLGGDSTPTVVTRTEPRERPQAPVQEVTPPETPPAVEPAAEDLQNPYWNLPNPLEGGPKLAPRGVITLTTEENWKAGLEGSKSLRYDTYLRYKTIQEIRKSRLKGSESLLTEALNQPKFWARMEALFGLAELGTPPDIDTVQNAIGNTRRALVKNYFKRFRSQANPAELYILRQAIRVVDAGARLVILEVLANQTDSANSLYFYAASFDPNPQIQGWYQRNSQKFQLTEEQKSQFKRYASGQETPPAPKTPPPEVVAPPRPLEPPMQDLKVEELPHDVNVEEVYFLNEEEKTEEDPEDVEVEEIDDGFDALKAP